MNTEELIKIGIAQGQYPERLYKYRTIDSAIITLREPSIYLSSITDFNDPYEGHYLLDADNTKQEWFNFLHTQGGDSCEAEALAQQLISDPQKAKEFQEKSINNVLSSSGVYCFGKKCDNILMWAYYAEDHRGVCIEFDPLKDDELCNILLPINYSNNYVQFNYLKDNSGPTKAILQKAKCWEREEEYRLIKINKAKTILKIKPSAITAVVLGCNFNKPFADADKEKEYEAKRKQLFDLLKDPKYSHVKIKQCQQANDNYQLIINEYEN